MGVTGVETCVGVRGTGGGGIPIGKGVVGVCVGVQVGGGGGVTTCDLCFGECWGTGGVGGEATGLGPPTG